MSNISQAIQSIRVYSLVGICGLVMIAVFGPMMLNKVGFDNLDLEVSQEKMIIIIGILVMMFLVLMFHELGHLITGLLQGFRFEQFVIGALGFKRDGERVRMYLNKNLEYYGGIAATSPWDSHPDNAKKFAFVLLAGPIASVLFALYSLVVSQLLEDHILQTVFLSGAGISIAIFLVTTIPAKTGIFYTDRKRYQRLVKPGRDQDTELAILKIMGSYAQDNSYKNIKKEDIQTLITDESSFTQYFGMFNLICYQIEMGEVLDERVIEEYANKGKSVSQSLVKAFNKEIDNLCKKYGSDSPIPGE